MPNQGTDQRPDPDALLLRVKAEEARTHRAKLKVFFGFAPGVGKTYAMLEAAQRLHSDGVDVLVGCVETHGRSETMDLLRGLPTLPQRVVTYRGTTLSELDVDAAVARKPAVLLVDELAHTNAPGSRHAKRWQDVLDLLDAGIDVHTTLNVQHVESLNEVVAQITTVRVRETVPDQILDRADEIELVDLPPETLLARLASGKVYVPETASRAAAHFFQRGNLLALRELALRRTADRVDADVQAYREAHSINVTWPAVEKILVCVGPSPASERLVRGAARVATGLRAPCLAVYVERHHEAPLSEADSSRLEAHLRLAESLGAEVVRLSGPSVAEALIEYARNHNVTRIIIGKPTHSRLRDLLRGSLLDEVVRGSGDIDVQVIAGDGRTPTFRSARESPSVPRNFTPYAWTLLFVAAATAVGHLAWQFVALPDLVAIYLLIIVLAAVFFGRGPSILAAAASVLAYDFFFVPPYHTFAVSNVHHLLTFPTMFGVGILISELMVRIRRQTANAREREVRTASLYALSSELGQALDETRIAEAITTHASKSFARSVALFLRSPDGSHRMAASLGTVPVTTQEDAVVRWVLEHGRRAGAHTDTLPGATITCVPLVIGDRVLGVMAFAAGQQVDLRAEDRHFLHAFKRQAAAALDRARLAEDAKSAAIRARTEEMRSSLLSAVSHDLRTPLAAITGAATLLRDDPNKVSADQRTDLVETICEESERLELLVGNLLDMTRLEAGAMPVRREWVPVDEIIGGALTRVEPRLGARTVTVELAPDLPLVAVDPVLMAQVFINLLENAAKYTPAASPVRIRAAFRDQSVVIDVVDAGPGIPPGDTERVFDKFYRTEGAGPQGVGLGLAICRGIVEAHGGRISVENVATGGACFRVVLPVPTSAPGLDAAASAAGTSP